MKHAFHKKHDTVGIIISRTEKNHAMLVFTSVCTQQSLAMSFVTKLIVYKNENDLLLLLLLLLDTENRNNENYIRCTKSN